MVREKNYLVEKLKESGIKSQIYTTMKKLKACSECHVGAVLRDGESFTRSNGKKKFSSENRTMKRVRYYDRETKLKVIIADNNEENVESILEKFLISVGKGIEVNGDWVEIEVGDADWVEAGDSILKSKIAVELEIVFKGSLYVNREVLKKDISVTASREEQNGDN